MIMQMEEENRKLGVGDIVIENFNIYRKKRLGEIIFIRSGRKNDRKFELVELNRHDLSPVTKFDMTIKRFTLKESNCEKFNHDHYRQKSSFELGQTICDEHETWSRYGRIIGFLHPDGLYSNSYERGHNGKDLLECVEISPRNGLPRKILKTGQPKIFCAQPNRASICEILPMDKNGGLRINR